MPILDSDILIGILRNEPGSEKIIDEIESKQKLFATTAINEFELMLGALIQHDSERKLLKVEELLSSFQIYSFTESASRIAANIQADLRRKGTLINLNDVYIASIAILNNEELITRDIEHFKRIEGLKIRKW